MTMTDNKTIHRDTMVFPFRWFISLNELPDKEFRQMFMAIGEYAKNETLPPFSGALSALWKEYQQRIDADLQKYIDICQRNNKNGLNGGRPPKEPKKPNGFSSNPKEPKKPNGFSSNPKEPKKPDPDPDNNPDPDNKERTINSSKETAEPFSLTSENSKIIPFKKWTPEQFKAEVAKCPEYAEIADAFTGYWMEPTAKGKMRFQTEKAWDTKRRLSTWERRDSNRDAAGANNEMSSDEQIAEIQGR